MNTDVHVHATVMDTKLLEKRGVDMDMDTELVENRGVDMDMGSMSWTRRETGVHLTLIRRTRTLT